MGVKVSRGLLHAASQNRSARAFLSSFVPAGKCGNPGAPATYFNLLNSVLPLGWPLKPFDKYLYIGSLIKAIRENIKHPRGLPSFSFLQRLNKPEGPNRPRQTAAAVALRAESPRTCVARPVRCTDSYCEGGRW